MDQSIKNQIKDRGISEASYKKQLFNLTNGFESARLVRACIPQDGIIQFNSAELDRLGKEYDDWRANKNIVKFVPASGAASRMFKHLHHFSENKDSDLVKAFISRFDEFPFVDDLRAYFDKKSMDFDLLLKNDNWQEIIDGILKGLEYGECPKGMVKFHLYEGKSKNAFEEHIIEAIEYASCINQELHIHFTVPEQHKTSVESFLNSTLDNDFSEERQRVNIDFSKQLKSTDTIAVDLEGNLIQNVDGEILFRPGGHGALIHNLNTIDADLIFVKNIDNVVHGSNLSDTIFYKKALAGFAVSIQNQIFEILNAIKKGGDINKKLKELIPLFGLNIADLNDPEQIISALNKPIRVCGMVKNEGEPGGGPFWVEGHDGSISCQIVEKDQIDTNNEIQHSILKNSTHFNPVDLICLTKDFRGEKFELLDFIDDNAGFISEKSIQGMELKALELPGLWNGAMADWLTLFVEVSPNTFNPVKTVNDLLRPSHKLKNNA